MYLFATPPKNIHFDAYILGLFWGVHFSICLTDFLDGKFKDNVGRGIVASVVWPTCHFV